MGRKLKVAAATTAIVGLGALAAWKGPAALKKVRGAQGQLKAGKAIMHVQGSKEVKDLIGRFNENQKSIRKLLGSDKPGFGKGSAKVDRRKLDSLMKENRALRAALENHYFEALHPGATAQTPKTVPRGR